MSIAYKLKMENGRHSAAFLYCGNNIIVTQSLFDGITFSHGVEPDLKKKYFKLTKMAEKEIKLHWSIVNLRDVFQGV